MLYFYYAYYAYHAQIVDAEADIMESNKYGYIRVSTQDQNADRQRIALGPYHIPRRNLYIDKQSGKNFERPAYQRMLKRLKQGDILLIQSIDRLGRNYAEILDQWRFITRDIGADIKVLDMPLLDTTYCKDLLGTFISDLVLQILSFFAQIERDNLLRRQAEGISAAKARGVSFGRTSLALPENFLEIYDQWRTGAISGVEAADICGCSLSTLYEKTKQWRKKSHERIEAD
jgi:DNA invertase Pin-like site-specific DNA recombinase